MEDEVNREDFLALKYTLEAMHSKLDTLHEEMLLIKIKQSAHAPFVDRMIREEEARDRMYQDIKTKIIGSGIIGVVTTVVAILWWSVTHFFQRS